MLLAVETYCQFVADALPVPYVLKYGMSIVGGCSNLEI